VGVAGTYTAATYTNCLGYTALVSPLNQCGATPTVAACQAICDATPGCAAIKYAGRMNAVPPCGSGNNWCMPLGAGYSSCTSSADIWDMYYRSSVAGAPSIPSTSYPPPAKASSARGVAAPIALLATVALAAAGEL
jgi:hypothetical protein